MPFDKQIILNHLLVSPFAGIMTSLEGGFHELTVDMEEGVISVPHRALSSWFGTGGEGGGAGIREGMSAFRGGP